MNDSNLITNDISKARQRQFMKCYLSSKVKGIEPNIQECVEWSYKVISSLPSDVRTLTFNDPLFNYWLCHLNIYLFAESNISVAGQCDLEVILNPYTALGNYVLSIELEVSIKSDSVGRIPLPFYKSLAHTSSLSNTTIYRDGDKLFLKDSPGRLEIFTTLKNTDVKSIYHDWFDKGFTESVVSSYSDRSKSNEILNETMLFTPRMEEIAAVENAIGILNKYLLGFKDLFNKTISCWSPIKGTVVGHTTPSLPGTIYIKVFDDVISNAENILHETCHCLLDNILTLTPFLKNPESELYKSPWRPDLRPISGILHGTYVFSRIAHFYSLLIHDEPSCITRLLEVIKDVIKGVETLVSYGDFTEEGSLFLTRLSNEIENLNSIYLK